MLELVTVILNECVCNLQVQFEKITPDYCPICMNSPFCGRRMLKVELELHRTQRPSGHMRMVNIGDSKTNDGFGELFNVGIEHHTGPTFRPITCNDNYAQPPNAKLHF